MKVTKKVHGELAAIRRERSAAKVQAKSGSTKKSPVRKGSKKPTPPKAAVKAATPRRASKPTNRDPRLPAVGQTLEREFKGKTIKVKVTAEGFEYDGTTFKSISACARHIVGYMISGPVFFRLVEPKRPEAK
jgi:hypothetical protein